jgi:hypothetical protein
LLIALASTAFLLLSKQTRTSVSGTTTLPCSPIHQPSSIAATPATLVIMATTAKSVLNRLTPSDVSMEIKDPVNPEALKQAEDILNELLPSKGTKSVHAESLLAVAKRLKDVTFDAATISDLIVSKEACKRAFDELPENERTALVNIHGRIKAFADMQRKSVVDMEMDIPGGKAGHTVSPCKCESPKCLKR